MFDNDENVVGAIVALILLILICVALSFLPAYLIVLIASKLFPEYIAFKWGYVVLLWLISGLFTSRVTVNKKD